MSWISGPCNDESGEVSGAARNVEKPSDEEREEARREIREYEIADQGTHFAKNLGHWSTRPRGIGRD